MKLSSRGFTLMELVIVIMIIGALALILYPQMTGYMAKGRDANRVTAIRESALLLGQYRGVNGTYPSNINKLGDTSYCFSDLFGWEDALPQFKDKQFSLLGGTGAIRRDPVLSTPSIGICSKNGSFLYIRVDAGTQYAILAARMETDKAGANYNTALTLRPDMPASTIDILKGAAPIKNFDINDDKLLTNILN